MFHVAKFMFCFHHHLMLPSSFLSGRWRGGGGDLLVSHTQLPLLNFSKMPFALFVGTNNLHSVQCVCNQFATMHQAAVVQAALLHCVSQVVFQSSEGRKWRALKSSMSSVFVKYIRESWGSAPPNFCYGVLWNSLNPGLERDVHLFIHLFVCFIIFYTMRSSLNVFLEDQSRHYAKIFVHNLL